MYYTLARLGKLICLYNASVLNFFPIQNYIIDYIVFILYTVFPYQLDLNDIHF